MLYSVAVIAGVVIALGGIVVARKLDAERVLFGWGLVFAAFWYIAFGLLNGQTLAALTAQCIAGAVFLVLAFIGLTKSMVFTGVGWILHIVWDVIGPRLGEVAAPWWTASVCMGFDAVIGVYILVRLRRVRPAASDQA